VARVPPLINGFQEFEPFFSSRRPREETWGNTRTVIPAQGVAPRFAGLFGGIGGI
jgi:hypothetical protein